MNARRLFAACACLLPVFAAARAETFGFKGVELGSNIANVASNPKYDCRAVTTPIADKVCSLRAKETETIAGAPVDALFYFYDSLTLTGIVISFDERHFQPVVAALTDKYGPGQLSREPVRNLKGVAFENHSWLWRKPEGSLQALRYAGRLDKSSIRITDEGAASRIQQRRALLAKDPRKDL